MFTGLIEETGRVANVDTSTEGAVLKISAALATGLKLGDSIAVNGACLTATRIEGEAFFADVMNESLARTALGELKTGAGVNLELPLAVGDRLDGHIVQGHVDGVGTVSLAEDAGFSRVLRVSLPDDLARYAVEKGSVTVDGVSLTVSGVGDDWIEVSLIPETLERTTLGDLRAGSRVNLEVDILAKHVERLLHHPSNS
ncbi:MAG: riboflavin synthase [Solirubrobacterales bacterium]